MPPMQQRQWDGDPCPTMPRGLYSAHLDGRNGQIARVVHQQQRMHGNDRNSNFSLEVMAS